MSSLKANLQHSTNACAYVVSTLRLGGANWDQYRKPDTSWEYCIQTQTEKACAPKKDPVDICLYEQVRPAFRRKIASAKTMLEKIKIISEEAKLKQCGNCGEFSALAFMYLYQKGVRPLDWMALVGGDHAFVVIGRDKKGSVDKPLSWGPTAAICDPWGQGFRSGDTNTGTYAASTFASQMGGLVSYSGIKSLHREG